MNDFSPAEVRRNLGRNLVAGLRLAFFRPVAAADFRVTVPDFAALALFNLCVAFFAAIIRNGVPGTPDFGGLFVMLGQLMLVLAAALFVALLAGRVGSTVAIAVMLIAADSTFEVVGALLSFAGDSGALDSLPLAAALSAPLFVLWSFVTAVRALLIATAWRGRRAFHAGGIVAALFVALLLAAPSADLWVPTTPQGEDDTTEPEPSILDETLFHRQQALLDETLRRLAPERRGVTDLYFLGVAPDASQDVFLKETLAARKLFDERFGTAGRSMVLANNSQSLADMPIATATNLRQALARIGRIMNPEEDVLFLFITSHGDADHELAVDLAPLDLQQLTPTALARMLHDSGIKWKVIVVSACYSGGFVEPLRDQNSVIITAADDKSTSFGCEQGNDFTYFGKAFIDEALRKTYSFSTAFAEAKRVIAEREQRERLDPSSPQIHVGAAIREKLAMLERRFAGLR